MEINLAGKNAIVCGSTAGIGKAIAESFAKSGANVTLLARDEEKLKFVRDSLTNNNSQIHQIIAVDFEKPELLKNKVTQYRKNNQSVHILVNNTGGPPPGPIIKADPEDFLIAYKMHLINNQILVKLFIEGMKEEKYGRIINIISTSVRQPIPNLGVSNTTRGAVGNWAKTLAHELGPFGITVNNVLPGPTKTGRLTSIIQKIAKERDIPIEKVEEEMISTIPLRRFGKPIEVANAALFLASEAASFITGINIVVDGGRSKCY